MLLQLILTQVITFVVLIVVLRFLFYRHLNAALSRLKDLNEKALAKEAQINSELETAKQQKAAQIEQGRQEAKRLIDEANKQAEAIRADIQEQSRQDVQKGIAHGQEELEKLRKNQMADISNQALRMSEEIIRYTFTQQGIMDLQHTLIDEIIKEIETIEKEKFSVKTDKVLVASSFPLNETERQNLRRIISVKTDCQVVLEETIDQQLITGLVIRMGALVIDGSLRNKLHKALPFIKNNGTQ